MNHDSTLNLVSAGALFKCFICSGGLFDLIHLIICDRSMCSIEIIDINVINKMEF